VWPPATDLKQGDRGDTLSVFEHEFAIGVAMSVAPGRRARSADRSRSIQLQACDEVSCYGPLDVDVEWPVTLVAGPVKSASLHDGVFKTIPFGHGEKPDANTDPSFVSASVTPHSGDPLAQLDGFQDARATGGYMGSGEFLTFIRNAEKGSCGKKVSFERPGAAIL